MFCCYYVAAVLALAAAGDTVVEILLVIGVEAAVYCMALVGVLKTLEAVLTFQLQISAVVLVVAAAAAS